LQSSFILTKKFNFFLQIKIFFSSNLHHLHFLKVLQMVVTNLQQLSNLIKCFFRVENKLNLLNIHINLGFQRFISIRPGELIHNL